MSEKDALRFANKINFAADNDCWEWSSTKNSHGYGVFKYKYKMWLAHRLLFHERGIKINKKVLMHRCDNRACLNPRHITVGTQGENLKDMYSKGRDKNSKKTHCKAGHLFDFKNTKINNRGARICLICDFEYRKMYYKK